LKIALSFFYANLIHTFRIDFYYLLIINIEVLLQRKKKKRKDTMEQKELNLLNESLGLHNNNLFGQLVLVEDTVDTSAAFVLHHILKLSFSSHPSSAVIFLALSHPFSHYDRILRKIVISLSLHLYFASLLFLLNLCVCFVFFSILGAGYLFFFYFIKLFNFLRFFFVVVSPDTSNWRGIDTCH